MLTVRAHVEHIAPFSAGNMEMSLKLLKHQYTV